MWKRDKIEKAWADRERSQAGGEWPYRFLRRSTPESRSSDRHGFARQDDKVRPAAPNEKCGAKSFHLRGRHNEETIGYYKYCCPGADARSETEEDYWCA